MPVKYLADAPLVMLRPSGEWGENREPTNPELMAKMAEEVSGLVFAGRAVEVSFEYLTIAQSATEKVVWPTET